MKLIQLLILVFIVFSSKTILAQNAVGIGTNAPSSSSALDISSTNKGVLVPRMTSTQRTAIVSPANGLMVYDITTNSFWFYKTGTGWTEISSGTSTSAYWTNFGNDVLNLNSGGIGIGPVAVTPLRAKLEVYSNGSATSAIFGNNFDGAGISIKNSYPGIAFNLYNTPTKRLGAGFGGLLDLNQTTGNFSYYGADSGVADGLSTNTLRFRITKNGSVGLQGATNPVNPLTFSNAVGNKIDLMNAATATTGNYGIGTASNQMLFYVPGTSQSMLWGTGYAAGFTERMRLTGTGNLGIGISSPTNPLSFPATLGKKISLYPGATGDAGIGVFANELRLYSDYNNADITFGYDNFSSGFTERMRVKANGNVGIGTNAPTQLLDVNGRMRLRHNVNTSGIWFDNSLNAEASFIGQVNDSTFGIWDNPTISNWRFRFDHKNAKMGIGNTNPKYPLVFEDAVGDKISLYGGNTSNTTNHYGLGIQAYTFQMYLPDNSAHFSFGYGRSGAFTELARLDGSGQFLIGTNASVYQNHFRGNNTRMLVLDNTALHMTGTENALSFKTGGRFDGIIKTIATGTNTSRLGFFTYSSVGETGLLERMSITDSGHVLIGTTNEALGKGYSLRVNGKIICTELRVQTQGLWPDYVFEKNYKLMPLSDLKKYLEKEKHLPNIPSAAEVSTQGGIDAGDMQKRLTEKVEELTLYILDLQKQIDELKSK